MGEARPMGNWNQRQIEGAGLLLVAIYSIVAAATIGVSLFGQLMVAISVGIFFVGVFLFYT